MPAPIHTVNGTQYRFTHHAAERALDMALDPDELLSVLRKPRKFSDSKAHPGRSYWSRGRVTLGVEYDRRDPEVVAVVTVLWSSAANWDLDYELAPSAKGRDRRAHFRESKVTA